MPYGAKGYISTGSECVDIHIVGRSEGAPPWQDRATANQMSGFQRDAVLAFFQLSANKKPIKAKDLEKLANVSSTVLKALVDKNIFILQSLIGSKFLPCSLTNDNSYFACTVANTAAFFLMMPKQKEFCVQKCLHVQDFTPGKRAMVLTTATDLVVAARWHCW